MRVVAAPHDLLDTDSVPLGALDRAHETRADVTLAGPVLARLERKRTGGGTGEPGDRRVRSRVAGRGHVQRGQRRRYPPGALLGEHHGEVGMAVQGAAEDQVPQRPMRPPVRLVHPDGERAAPPVGRARPGVAAMVVDHHPGLRARRPQRLPVLGVQRQDAGAGGDPGQQHPAAQAEFGDLRHLGDGFVQVPSRICPTPARRSGDSEQKSASQRLWARSPAQRSSSSRPSPAAGRPGWRAERTAARCWGKSPLPQCLRCPAHSCAARCSSCARRRARSGRRTGSRKSLPNRRIRHGTADPGSRGSRAGPRRRGSRPR